MRFDPDRALALVPRFSTLRLAGTSAEHEAADAVAELFARAGLVVSRGERTGTIPFEPSAVEVWPTAGLAIAFGVALQFLGPATGLAIPWILAAMFAVLVAVAVGLRLATRGLRWSRSVAAPYVAAESEPEPDPDREGSETPRSRVVFLTRLDTRPRIASSRFRRDLAILDWVWLAALWVPCLILGGWAWLTVAGPALLIGLGLISLMHRLDPWVHDKAPYAADNRTGLALLAELARSWPRDDRRRFDVRFVATSMVSSREEWHEVLGPSSGASTLVINLEAPGVGDVIFIAGSGTIRERAEQAARDLWLPARLGRWPGGSQVHRPFTSLGYEALSLVGDLDATRIEANVLAATAQVTTEIALRWAGCGDLEKRGEIHHGGTEKSGK